MIKVNNVNCLLCQTFDKLCRVNILVFCNNRDFNNTKFSGFTALNRRYHVLFREAAKNNRL